MVEVERIPIGGIVLTQHGHGLLGWFARATQGSHYTHVVLKTGPDEFVESAAFVGVRHGVLSARLEQLQRERREWLVLDQPALTQAAREAIAARALGFVGRRYDYAQAALWFFTGGFWRDGELRMVCSRLVTASYRAGAPGVELFPEANIRHLGPGFQADLKAGYCTPKSLYLHSSFTPLLELSWRPGAL